MQTALHACTMSLWLSCDLHAVNKNLSVSEFQRVSEIFQCYNASDMLSITDIKRSRCSGHSNQIQAERNHVAPSHYSGDIHLHASHWQQIKTFVLYEEDF